MTSRLRRDLSSEMVRRSSRPIRVATYTRVAFLDSRLVTNLDRRHTHLARAVASHPGWTHVVGYADVGPSRWDRPGLQRLLADATAGLLEAVVVEDLHALSSQVAMRQTLLAHLGASGVRVVALTDGTGRRRALSRLVALACSDLAWE